MPAQKRSRRCDRKPEAIERLARRLLAELDDIVGNRPLKWVMLGSVVRRLGVEWPAAEAAAEVAAVKGWVEHQMHGLLLREPGRKELS
jgi:hypothetical protein